MKRVIQGLLATCSILLVAIPVLAAPVGESAGEIWVDGPADKQPGTDPSEPDAAVDETGRSIFVWDGTPSSTRKEVFFRIFPANGGPPEDPVQINTYVENAQFVPRIAISSDGSFLVVWESAEQPNPGDNFLREVVRSQAFDENGTPVGDEQLLSTVKPLLATGHAEAEVAALRDGGYIVTWRSGQTNDPAPVNGITIQGRRIGADGVPLADQFQVNSRKTSEAEHYPRVVALTDGGFLVVWTVPQVHGRRFDADGTPIGDDFQINTLEEGTESETDVTQNEDGRILVVWKDNEGGVDGTEIRARLYSPGLVAQGQDFRVNTLLTGNQFTPKVASYGQEGFFVIWGSDSSVGNDNEPKSIEGRIVAGSNQFSSPQFLVNSWTSDTQQFPGIGGKNGRIAMAWKSGSNPETTANVINGQFWSVCGIFCDSFE